MEEKKKRKPYYNREHQAKYQAKQMTQISVKLNRVTDADIIERLDAQESKLGYIKRLIREDIERERGGE